MILNGKLIEDTRTARSPKLSRAELSRLVGCDVKTIYNAERNLVKPSAETIAKIAAILEIPLDNLFTAEPEKVA